MPRLPRIAIDLLAGGGLLLAALTVVLVDRLKTAPAAQASTGDLRVKVISAASSRRGAPQQMRLAVTPTERSANVLGEMEPWDDMGKLLNQLGAGYRHDTVLPRDILKQPSKLDGYDVLFLTCATGGEELKDALRNFVSRGGTLYASDFRYDAVAAAFPEAVGPAVKASGTSQDLMASIVDPSLREALGEDKIKLKFDLSQWKVAAFAGPRVTSLIRGKYRKERFLNDRVGVLAEGTFLVRFPFGKGTVIFTSFHNEKQNSDVERKLLEHLVFQLVNAGVDAEVSQTNESAGFEPAKSNLLSTPKSKLEVTKTYDHAKDGTLRFSLAFRPGATLGLKLQDPDGKTFGTDCNSTLILEIPEAKAGRWTYVITAKEVPFENFPFTASFGAKK